MLCLGSLISISPPEYHLKVKMMNCVVWSRGFREHTHTCQKNGRLGCRFDYPKQPSPETRLKTNADGGNKARFYIIKCEPGAEMVNPYNQHLVRAWRANMDV